MELKAQDLTCERGGRIVFADLAFTVASGELMQITGPNGSGKSSLLRLAAGLNEASRGSLTLTGGHGELSIGQQAHLIAHQDAVKTALTVAENLGFWQGFLGGGDVHVAMAAFDLTRLAYYPAGLLSAGQKRRLALARLALIPRVLWLLDEPATGLDTASQQLLSDVMSAQLQKGGMILAATHVPLGLEPQRTLQLGMPA